MTLEEALDKIIELNGEIKTKNDEIEVLTAEKADYTKQVEDFKIKVDELEETNKLKTEKISDLIMNTPKAVIDKKDDTQEDDTEEAVTPLDELIGGL